jgi:hypothetical protein
MRYACGMSNPEPVILQPPGAGFPADQKRFFKLIILPFYRLCFSWERAQRFWLHLNREIVALCQTVTPEALLRPVLIDPLPGLEDSSRQWSLAMTLEHLMITAEYMASLMIQLGRGQSPNLNLSTAAVKPKGVLGTDAVAQFTASMAKVEDMVSREIENRRSPAREAHPWFGPLTVRDWNLFLTIHHKLHLAQIRAIIQSLPK